MTPRNVISTLLLALAFSPVLFWYGSRLDDGTGEPLGLIALALALIFISQNPQPTAPRFAEISLALYALSLFFLPPLLRAIPSLATLAFLTGMHRRAGYFGLLILSLPLQASLDFFLGYPLRLITASASHFLLSMIIPGVAQIGVQLSHHDSIVSVDPPCSGIQMLWATAFLTALLAALFKLTYRRTVLLSLAALSLCLLANIFRASTLFFPESNLITLPGFAHQGIGLLFFAIAAFALIKLARGLQHQSAPQKFDSAPVSKRFLALASTVSLITLVPARTTQQQLPPIAPLTHYQGQAVEELPLSEQEIAFSKNFPGHLRLYRIGNDTLIVRHLTKATRMLHPSHHCLRADGFSLTTPGIRFDQNNRPTLSYQATRLQTSFRVTETIRNQSGSQHWAEVSAWYWHALLHPNSGPWIAETLLKPKNQKP